MPLKLSLILLLLFVQNSLFAQSNTQIVVQGTIYAQATKKPLPFATIAIQGQTIGTISNQKGQFLLRIPSKFNNASLVLSHIGYKSQRLGIQQIVNIKSYYLEEDAQVLQEVVVTGLTAPTIIRKALDKIPENYYAKPYTHQGFYRLTTQKEDKEYIQASEASFEVYNARPTNKNQLKLNKMRAIKHERLMENMELRLQPASIFESDIVQHLDDFRLLNKKGLKNHIFKLKGMRTYEGAQVYVIEFDQRPGWKKPGYKGEFWIDTQSFAFVWFDFGRSPQGIGYLKVGNLAERALMKLMKLKIKLRKERQRYRYQKIGNRYYFKEAQVDLDNFIRNGVRNFQYLSRSKLHYAVTNMQMNQATPFSEKEVLRNKKWIENQSEFLDKGFWSAYNIVLPEVAFATIAQKIDAENRANILKVEVEDWLRSGPKDKAARMDSIITYYHRKGLFAGNALVTYQGKVLLNKSYNRAYTRNASNTQFRIGSTSKTFTSMLVMLLVKSNQLKLSDPVGKFLPNYAHPQVTIAQLLTHQSGIPSYTNNSEYLQQVLSQPFSSQQMMQQFSSDSLEFVPGSKFKYSNSGYVVLANVIEKITGKPYGEVLQEKILKPLGMTQTYFGNRDNANLAKGYLYGKPEPTYPSQNNIGAGGIVSSVEDLLKWSQALDKDVLLPATLRNQLFVPRAEYLDWESDYGYGWMIDKYQFLVSKRHKVHHHPGTDLGFYSMFVKQPDEQITIILLSNTGDFPRFEMSDLILNELN
ncbi:hypothetical protein BKI52_42590 [marine bacterium AO1-C]|nr:hypothetical protein BKI52_42590 [marine bacterium AO1-C]